MIKNLRRKFIAVAMCSVFAVLSAVMCIVNIISYANVVNNADSLMLMLKEGGGSFGVGLHGKPISPETPYETRYYTVLLGFEGEALAVNVDSIAAIDAQEAATFAQELYKKGKTLGFYGNYRYSGTETKTGIMYIFVDCTRELTSFRIFLWNSIAVSGGSLLLVFILLLIFSGKVMKPVAESYAKQKRFITDASHEIKTPLTIIGADTDVIEMKDGASEWTQDIKEQVSRLTSLTEKLVFLARMDEEGRTLNSTTFCISDAVEEAVQPFRAVSLSRGIELNAKVQPNITYCGDESMIRQMLCLLVDNALKYTDGDEVDVLLESSGNKILLTVKNQASYMQSRNLDLLFERFYRNDSSRSSETGGHGIGLSVVQTIVAAHKGKITAFKDGNIISFAVTL